MNDEFRRLLRRLPFTTVLILALLTISSIAGVLSHPISSDQLRHWGFGWEDLLAGRMWHLLSAPFLVLRPYMALSITAILFFFVGSCELLLRTKRTIAVFVVSHLLGYLGTFALLRALGRLGWRAAEALTVQGDVGASNGAFGAIGALLVFLPSSIRAMGFLLL
ncbi:MAG TPA: rhomboid family intramembrane serine protease, partial [Candidatus Krumholzibacteria bacterium]|nr:rhomboid family intramembrane serine protease [Candidatus Krumholzibacteria bacterium]